MRTRTSSAAAGWACSGAAGALAALALLGAAPRAWAGELSIENAWMRALMPARPAAGYFTLRNAGGAAHELVGASSPDCGALMLHRSVQQGGTDRMEMVASVTVPPHGALRFAPGGYHLMCTDPAAAVRPGASVPVTLRFADGTALTANFPVKGPGGR